MNSKIGNVILVMLAMEASALAFQMFNRTDLANLWYTFHPTLFACAEYGIQAVSVISAWFVPITVIQKEIA
jgi:hypothetical protein